MGHIRPGNQFCGWARAGRANGRSPAATEAIGIPVLGQEIWARPGSYKRSECCPISPYPRSPKNLYLLPPHTSFIDAVYTTPHSPPSHHPLPTPPSATMCKRKIDASEDDVAYAVSNVF